MSNISEAHSQNFISLITIFSQIGMNPRNVAAYHQLIELYDMKNMVNEAEAFKELLNKIKNDNSTSAHQK